MEAGGLAEEPCDAEHDPDDQQPQCEARDRRHERLDQPDHESAGRLQGVLDPVQQVGGEVQPHLAQVHEHQVAADPEHRDRAEDADEAEHRRHRAHDPGAGVAHALHRILRHPQADVVDLHEQRDRTVDDARHEEGDHGEDGQRRPDVEPLLETRERDEHDLGGEDQVGAHGAQHELPLVARALVGVAVLHAEPLQHLLRALEAEVGPAEDQQIRQHPRRERGQQQRHRDDDQELVRQRPQGDLADDGELPGRSEALNVLRRDRGVIDHDTRRLRRRLHRRAQDVVDDGQKSNGHACVPLGMRAVRRQLYRGGRPPPRRAGPCV